MVLLRICSKSRKKAEEIATFLLQKKLIMDVNLKADTVRLDWTNGKLNKSKIYVLTGKTKALLFTKIDDLLRQKYGEQNLPEIYSLAIVHMDWEQADQLVRNTEKV